MFLFYSVVGSNPELVKIRRHSNWIEWMNEWFNEWEKEWMINLKKAYILKPGASTMGAGRYYPPYFIPTRFFALLGQAMSKMLFKGPKHDIFSLRLLEHPPRFPICKIDCWILYKTIANLTEGYFHLVCMASHFDKQASKQAYTQILCQYSLSRGNAINQTRCQPQYLYILVFPAMWLF